MPPTQRAFSAGYFAPPSASCPQSRTHPPVAPPPAPVPSALTSLTTIQRLSGMLSLSLRAISCCALAADHQYLSLPLAVFSYQLCTCSPTRTSTMGSFSLNVLP